MNSRVKLINYILLLLIFTNFMYAEDEAKKSSKPEIENKSNNEKSNIEISGILTKEDGKDKNQNYFILTSEKKQVYLPNKIGDKEIDFTTLLNKKVTAKGKGKVMSVMTTTGCIESVEFNQLLSIDLADETNKKVDDKKKEGSKKDAGNVPVN